MELGLELQYEIICLGLIAVYILISVLFKFSYKIAIATGLILLLASAASLIIGEKVLSSRIGVIGFYFLFSGVIICLVDYLRKR